MSRVARFDGDADESPPAPRARLGPVEAGDGQAAAVADLGADPAPPDAAPVADFGAPDGGVGGTTDGPDPSGRPPTGTGGGPGAANDDPDGVRAEPAPVADLDLADRDLADGPRPGSVATARFGDSARGGRRGARSRSVAPTERVDDEGVGTGRSGRRSTGFGSSGSDSTGPGSRRSGFGSSGFGGRSPRGRAATRRAEAEAAERAEGVADGSATEPAASAAPRRGFGPKQVDPDADPVAAAREICLRLLTDRSRTRHELAQALTRRGVPDDAADTVLSRFDEVGLIDDAAFAGQWVRSRHNHRGLARRAIAMELRRKGVDDEVAGEALEEVDDDSEARRARELVDRKLRTVPADTPEQRKKAANRLVGMLARKGYGGGVAYRVVREALAAHGAELDELGTDAVD